VGLRDAQEAAAAAEQIPDVSPADATVPQSGSVTDETLEESSSAMEGEEVLKTAVIAKQKSPLDPPVKKKRLVRGIATENSPFVRRRDGTFTFRNKELERVKAELKQQRKDCVRDSLFKLLDDSEEPISISIP
jgi:hypothetical protein